MLEQNRNPERLSWIVNVLCYDKSLLPNSQATPVKTHPDSPQHI